MRIVLYAVTRIIAAGVAIFGLLMLALSSGATGKGVDTGNIFLAAIALLVAVGLVKLSDGMKDSVEKREARREFLARERGFALLAEMLIACFVMLALSTVGLVSAVAVTQANNQKAARLKVEITGASILGWQACALAKESNGNLQCGEPGDIPVPGIQTQQGYQYTFAGDPSTTWNYSAAPIAPMYGHFAYYMDQTGTLRCALNEAGSDSPVCR